MQRFLNILTSAASQGQPQLPRTPEQSDDNRRLAAANSSLSPAQKIERAVESLKQYLRDVQGAKAGQFQGLNSTQKGKLDSQIYEWALVLSPSSEAIGLGILKLQLSSKHTHHTDAFKKALYDALLASVARLQSRSSVVATSVDQMAPVVAKEVSVAVVQAANVPSPPVPQRAVAAPAQKTSRLTFVKFLPPAARSIPEEVAHVRTCFGTPEAPSDFRTQLSAKIPGEANAKRFYAVLEDVLAFMGEYSGRGAQEIQTELGFIAGLSDYLTKFAAVAERDETRTTSNEIVKILKRFATELQSAAVAEPIAPPAAPAPEPSSIDVPAAVPPPSVVEAPIEASAPEVAASVAPVNCLTFALPPDDLSFSRAYYGTITSGTSLTEFGEKIAGESAQAEQLGAYLRTERGALLCPGFTVEALAVDRPVGSSILFNGSWSDRTGAAHSAVLKLYRGPTVGQQNLDLLRSMDHPLIMQPLWSYQIAGRTGLVLPKADSSLNRFYAESQSLPDADRAGRVMGLALQVAQGLHYLHHRGRIHGDLKGSHVLSFDAGTRAKITALTSSQEIVRDAAGEPTAQFIDCGGTPGFMAPETYHPIVRQGRQLEGNLTKLDVYALGCLLWEMLTGEPPLRAAARANAWSLRDWALEVRGKRRNVGDAGFEIPSELIGKPEYAPLLALVKACCQFHPLDRPTMAQVVAFLERGTPLPVADS